MFSPHHPFAASGAAWRLLSIGSSTQQRRKCRRRRPPSSSNGDGVGGANTASTHSLRPTHYHPAQLHRTLLTLMLWCFCVVMAGLPEATVASAPKYETAYACEGKTLTIECEPGDIINLIRANYGRFSITICNDHGNVDWSVNCMSAKSLRVLHTKCALKQNCSVLASTNMFGDPCPGTHKYLEAHYQCMSATQTSTTTNRPSPPWLITSQPSVWSTSTVRVPTTTRFNVHDASAAGSAVAAGADGFLPKTSVDKTGLHHHQQQHKTKKPTAAAAPSSSSSASVASSTTGLVTPSTTSLAAAAASASFAGGSSGSGEPSSEHNNAADAANKSVGSDMTNGLLAEPAEYATQPSVLLNHNTDNYFCGPKTARNLFWNTTRVGEVNVQPCPGGATGIAKWRCVFARTDSSHPPSFYPSGVDRHDGGGGGADDSGPSEFDGGIDDDTTAFDHHHHHSSTSSAYASSAGAPRTSPLTTGHQSTNQSSSVHRAVAWQPATPDLTYCRSLWLNSLEVRVNQRDSSLISIANDLSQVTSSKTLYGGDMLVTTKIIQTMSEKMTYDIETFPDQRQRESIVLELLNGVVRTGSNLLDATQNLSWLDLSFEDQMRVATSLLTGIEDNAFLLADTIIREWNVVQKAKNILLSVRVLETRNIVGNEVFPDVNYEQWHVSDDRIELPRGALIENSEGGLVRIVFVAFDRLEAILKPAPAELYPAGGSYPSSGSASSPGGSFPSGGLSASSYGTGVGSSSSGGGSSGASSSSASGGGSSTAGGADGNGLGPDGLPIVRQRVLNSKVISASLGKGRHIQLSQPIRLVLRHLKTENVTNPSCVFWNYIDHAWSEDGCFVDHTNRTHTICMCNHLTNFAILMDVVDDASGGSMLGALFNDDLVLRLIYGSAIGCILLVAAALLALRLFHGTFVKHSNRTTITKNLYASVLVLELLFVVGISLPETSWMCGFTAAFLHCAFLCVVAWVFVEGFQLNVTLTTEEILLEVEKSSKLIWYYLLTYGLSFTVVAISLAIDPAAYTQSDFGVWMEPAGLFYCTFVTPIMIFVLATIVYSVLSSFILCRKHRTSLKNKEHIRLASVRFYLRCSAVFLGVLVACWTLCFAYMNAVKMDSPNASCLGYLFAVLNLGQGVCLLTCHCLHNEKIRYEYSKFVRQQSWLPRCLRCTQQTPTSTIGGGGGGGGGGAPGEGGASKVSSSGGGGVGGSGLVIGSAQHTHQRHRGAEDGDMSGGDATATLQHHQHHHHQTKVFKHPHLGGGTLGLQSNMVVVEREAGGRLMGGDQTSPTSSAGSTHLIYNTAGQPLSSDMQPDWSYQQSAAAFAPTASSGGGKAGSQPFLHHPTASHHYHHQMSLKLPSSPADYHKNSMSSLSSNSSPSPRQIQRTTAGGGPMTSGGGGAPKEYFYWTEKRPAGRRSGGQRHPSGQNPESTALAGGHGTSSSHIMRSDTMNAIYPSYRKNPSAQYSSGAGHLDPDDEDDDDQPGSYLARYDQQQRQFAGGLHDGGYDDDDDETTAKGTMGSGRDRRHHHHHHQSSMGGGHRNNASPPPLGGIEHLQMLLQNNQSHSIPVGRGGGGGRGGMDGGGFYSQYQAAPGGGYAIEEPVYEEIMSNRGSRTDADDGVPVSPTASSSSGGRLDEDNHMRQQSRPHLSSYAFQSALDPASGNHLHHHQQQQQPPPTSSHTSSHHHLIGGAPPLKSVGRNLSAMLDENNTVVCYLEPKQQ